LGISITTTALGVIRDGTSNTRVYSGPRASMAVSGDNVYLTWWDNKTGNNEVFFAGSSDGGKSLFRLSSVDDLILTIQWTNIAYST
jgi:hypothetical protein